MTLKGKIAEKASLGGKVLSPELVQGLSAYEVALQNGFEGTEAEWLETLVGPQGERGATGAKVVSTVLKGQDASGGNIYEQTFDDGTVAEFVAPRGEKGVVNITQEMGNSTTSAMSQKASTAEFNIIKGALNKSLSAIISLQNGAITPVGEFETDSSVAYVKDVPENALPYAEVKKVGGMTYKDGDTLKSAIVTEVESVGANLFDKTKATLYQRVASDDGTIASGFSEVSLSDYINVKGISTVYISGDAIQTQTEHSVAFFDENKVFISGENTHAAPVILTNKMYNVPSNACYVRFNFAHSAIDSIQFEVGVTASPYTPYQNHTLPIPVEVRGSMNLTTAEEVYNGADRYAEMVVDGRNCIRFTSGIILKNKPITFNPNTQYTVSFYAKGEDYNGATTANIGFTFFYEDGTSSDINVAINAAWTLFTLTSDNGKNVVSIGLDSMEYRAYVYLDTDTFMLNIGTTALPYEPYGITGLDGYGLGVSDTVYSYIDLERKQFVKKCPMVDLGTLDWTVVDGENYAYSMSIRNSVKQFGTILHSGLPTGIKTINIDSASAIVVIFNNATFSVDSLKAALSGVMLVYELATPVVTDISDLLSEDNFIGVEGNGTLTFKNAYEYAVPSEIEYQVGV